MSTPFQFVFDAKTARAVGYKVSSKKIRFEATAGLISAIQSGAMTTLEIMHAARATPTMKMSADKTIRSALNSQSTVLKKVLPPNSPVGEKRLRFIMFAASLTHGNSTLKFAAMDDNKKTMTIYTVDLYENGINGDFVSDYSLITRNRGISASVLNERLLAL